MIWRGMGLSLTSVFMMHLIGPVGLCRPVIDLLVPIAAINSVGMVVFATFNPATTSLHWPEKLVHT